MARTQILGSQILDSTVTTDDIANSAVTTAKLNINDNVNFNNKQATNLIVHVLTDDPGSPVEGQLWYNSTEKQWKGYNGTAVVILG